MSLLAALAKTVRERGDARKRAQLDTLKLRYALECWRCRDAGVAPPWRLLGKIRRLERELNQPRLF